MKKDDFIKIKTTPQLFAYGENANFHSVDSSSSGFSYQMGIPAMYSSRTGKKVNRADMNGLVRMMSQAPFFNQSGGYYTFNASVSEAIGGYPLGAILNYYDVTTNKVRKVRSLIANNTYNFVDNPEYINEEYWQYVDNVIPTGFRPRIYPDYSSSLKSSGKLNTGSTFLARTDSLFIIQSGMDASKETTGTETGAYVWLSVKRATEDSFYSAGMLGYTAPITSVMNGLGRLAHSIDGTVETLATYTSFYSSSPIQIYLHSGDTVKIEANMDFSFSADYVCYPLKS